MTRRGCYPGTFDPPTTAHLAIAEASLAAAGLDVLDFVLSREPLGKAHATPVAARAAVLRAVAASRTWMGVSVVDARLIADVATGYDVLVVGADKWLQVVDPTWYSGSTEMRDRALVRLPKDVLVVPRPGHATPPGVVRLEVAPHYGSVSSSGVRDGTSLAWMLPEAARAGLWGAPSTGRHDR